jgi:hypothetical protein
MVEDGLDFIHDGFTLAAPCQSHGVFDFLWTDDEVGKVSTAEPDATVSAVRETQMHGRHVLT